MTQPAQQSTAQPIAVSPQDAAAMIGISVALFYKQIMPLVYGGTIKSRKIGRRRVILVESLREWMYNGNDQNVES